MVLAIRALPPGGARALQPQACLPWSILSPEPKGHRASPALTALHEAPEDRVCDELSPWAPLRSEKPPRDLGSRPSPVPDYEL